MKEKDNIIKGIDEDGETVFLEPLTEYNGNWIQAARKEREGNTEEVERMKQSKEVLINDD